MKSTQIPYETRCCDCPFSGQDCIYCRNCQVPMLHEKLSKRRNHRRRRKLRKLSDVLWKQPASDVHWFVLCEISRLREISR